MIAQMRVATASLVSCRPTRVNTFFLAVCQLGRETKFFFDIEPRAYFLQRHEAENLRKIFYSIVRLSSKRQVARFARFWLRTIHKVGCATPLAVVGLKTLLVAPRYRRSPTSPRTRRRPPPRTSTQERRASPLRCTRRARRASRDFEKRPHTRKPQARRRRAEAQTR